MSGYGKFRKPSAEDLLLVLEVFCPLWLLWIPLKLAFALFPFRWRHFFFGMPWGVVAPIVVALVEFMAGMLVVTTLTWMAPVETSVMLATLPSAFKIEVCKPVEAELTAPEIDITETLTGGVIRAVTTTEPCDRTT